MQVATPLVLASALLTVASETASAPRSGPPRPEVFAPGQISGPADVDSATFTPDGETVVFDRSLEGGSTIMISHRRHGVWSRSVVAPFSGTWSDKDPAMAPDGSFLVFGSNRPPAAGGKPLDMVGADGAPHPGRGDQLWRVDRKAGGWGEPQRLPDVVNDGARLYSPSVAADGSVYFQKPVAGSRTYRLFRSQYRDGRYQAPTPVSIGPEGADERDPAIAPDESFIVYSANYAAEGAPDRLHIAFRLGDHWSPPADLGDAVNHDGAEGPHLGPDRAVYFDSGAPAQIGPTGQARPAWDHGNSHIWRLSLAPWLDRAPRLFAPEARWPAGTDASPAFTPDGRTVVFTHSSGAGRTIIISHLRKGAWSKPEPAPFSGTWRDIEPAMAPDGSYLVFISNRPATAGGEALTGFWGGQSRPGAGGNIWRVDRHGGGWGKPVRLPDVVNSNSAIYSPAVAGDGSLYFNQPDPVTHKSHIYRAQKTARGFEAPTALSISDGTVGDFDAAVAPDESYLVFSSGRPPAKPDQPIAFITFQRNGHWTAPEALQPLVEGIEARLSPDRTKLYVSTEAPRIDGPAEAAAPSRIFQVPFCGRASCPEGRRP